MTACPPGSGYVAGSLSSDSACSPCPSGEYSAVEDNTICTIHSSPTCDAHISMINGTTSADAACATTCDPGTIFVDDVCTPQIIHPAPSPSAGAWLPSPAPINFPSPAPTKASTAPGACSLNVSTWDANHNPFLFSAGRFTISDTGFFSNGLRDDHMRALYVPRGCTAVLFNDSTFKGTNYTLSGPNYYQTLTVSFGTFGVSSIQILDDPTYGQTVNVTAGGVVDGVGPGAAQPIPGEVPSLVPVECWEDFLLGVSASMLGESISAGSTATATADSAVSPTSAIPAGGRGKGPAPSPSHGVTGGQTPSNVSDTDAVIAERVKPLPLPFLSARVNAAMYGRRGNNPGAFWPLDGLFLAVGRGGEQATIVVSDSPRCAGIASGVVNVTVTVGGVVATILNRSEDGRRIIVGLPSYDEVCFAGGCGASQAIRVQGTQLMMYAPPSAWWAVNKVVSWACPPSCPAGTAARATMNKSSQLHLANTAALRKAVGGIMYVQSCNTSSVVTGSTSPPSSPSPSLTSASTAVGTAPSRTRSATAAEYEVNDRSSVSCNKAKNGIIPFITDPRSCLDPAQARSAPCAYGGGDTCECCPANARCPGGARTWPERGFW